MTPILSPRRELFDLSYQNKSQQLSLSIQIDKSFAYSALYDESNHQYVGLKDFDLGENTNWELCLSKLNEAISGMDKHNNKLVKVFFTDPIYTLVPTALFDENQLDKYLSFNHPIDNIESFDLAYDKLLNQEIALVYAIPCAISSLFNNVFTNTKFHHYTLPLLESFLLERDRGQKIGLHIQKQHFDIVYKKDNRLQYLNSFTYKSVEDILYFLLYAMEQLKANPEEVPLVILGEFEQNSDLYKTIFRYIRTVKAGERTTQANYSQVLQELQNHSYHIIFNQHLCG